MKPTNINITLNKWRALHLAFITFREPFLQAEYEITGAVAGSADSNWTSAHPASRVKGVLGVLLSRTQGEMRKVT